MQNREWHGMNGERMKKLEGKIALITGASRGIGAAVAKRYAAEGAQVVLVARNVEGLEAVDDAIRQAGGKPAVIVPLDVTDGTKVDALGASLYERFGHLDILVGNAGVLGELTPLSHLDPKIWQKVMDVNVTANWRLLRICDPLLRRSKAGRAIFVSSGVTQGHCAYWGAYTVSKAALEAMIFTYAKEIANSGVKANLIDPGAVRTDMRAAAMPGEDPATLPAPETITDRFVELALENCTHNGARLHAQR
jgi:NAD(P)-dependent dehydrogenase (short-subunit alcohol dehydrogenase family)